MRCELKVFGPRFLQNCVQLILFTLGTEQIGKQHMLKVDQHNQAQIYQYQVKPTA